MRSFHGIKPQDVLLLLKLIVNPRMAQKELAASLAISPSEVSHGFKRLKLSRLISSDGSVNREAALEFLVHGLKYICPPEFGTLSAGIPTAYARPGFKFVRFNKDDVYVWPHPEGSLRGIALKPFYPTLPNACLEDEELYTLASLVEMIRIGRAREQSIASKELNSFLRKTS